MLSGAEPTLSEHVLAACVDELVGGVPTAIASIASGVIWGIADLPVDRPSLESGSLQGERRAAPGLDPHAPHDRRLLRPEDARRWRRRASVFIVVRVEEKGEPNAERFALKVPEYSATAARMTSEAEFSNMFRSEASALMAIPPHPNLARFVTFDAGAKPKPILVMELVEGPTLERVIESRALDMGRALGDPRRRAGGLEAMHEVGVGHLDLKPGNIVLRKQHEEAVLVDFGLAGRHIRPGCATGPYGAPEVWGALADRVAGAGRRLRLRLPRVRDVDGEGALRGGQRDRADRAPRRARREPSADRGAEGAPRHGGARRAALSTLRREPRQRATAKQLRERLRALGPGSRTAKWPLAT